MSTKKRLPPAAPTVLAEIRPDLSNVPAWVRALEGEWRATAETLKAHGAKSRAKLVQHLSDRLLEAACRSTEEVLTLAEAAAESGYTAAHLGKLIAKREIPNAGKKRSPRLRRSDLPKKPKLAAVTPRRQLHRTSRHQVARSLLHGDKK